MFKIPGVSGIRGQIMLMMIAIALIPVIITGVILYEKTSENIHIEVSEKMESLESAVAYDTTHLVMLRHEQAKVIAGTFLPKQMSSDGAHDPELLTRIQGHIESIADEIHQVPTSNYDMIDTRSAISIIGIWDKNGEIVANTDTTLIGKQMSSELMNGVAQKGTHFGGFINDPLTGENFLIILEEVRNWEDGELAGAVLLKVRAQVLNMIVSGEHIRTGETGEMYLLNRDHYMITESRFVDDAILNQQVNTEFVNACFNGEKNQGVYTNYMGTEVFGSTMYLPDQDWCIVTEVSTEEAFASATQIQEYTMIIAIIATVLIGFVSFMAAKGIVRSIMKPVIRVSKIAEKISKGDLTESVEASKSNDELGTLTNAIHNMTKNLRMLIGDTRSIATTVVKNANSVAASTEELNSGVEQVSTTVQQISTGSQSQASDLSDAKTIVDSVTNNTDGTSASDKMARIVELTKDSSDKVRGLAEKSAKITDVVEVIRGIAEKTNLLALNAAIEAARAGESGRGFAVVADEVRRLAEGSAKSSQEIDDLLREIQDEIKSTVTGIDESAKEVETGRDVVEKSLHALENIGKKVQEISAVSEQNAAASEQASASVEQQTAATEDISTSSQSMASLAGELETKVSQFKLPGANDSNIQTQEKPKSKQKSFKNMITKKKESIDDLVQTVKED